MRNRTLILHNQIVCGPGADDGQPVIPKQQGRSTQRSPPRDTGLRLPTEFSEKRTRSFDDDAMIQINEDLIQTHEVKGMNHKILPRKRMRRTPLLKILSPKK